MGRFLKTLKRFGKKLNGVEPQGTYITDVINNIANDYKGVAILEVNNITALTTAQIEALNCGDIVIKLTGNQKHRYVVSYKEAGVGICLTYVDAANVETVSYDYVDGEWVYNSTDTTHIAAE